MKKIILFILILVVKISFSQTWSPYGVGLGPNEVSDLLIFNNELYACGGFISSGSSTLNGIARWDGTNWNPLANGTNFGGPECMTIYNNDLIAGGSFISITGVPNAKGIARWDGFSWHALGGGVGIPGGDVRAMAVFNGSLYVGGSFTQVDGMPIRNIARWDGSAWFPVCTLSTGLSTLWSMTVYNNELYIGGYFDRINGDTIYNVAKFDGTTWSDVDGGLNSDVAVLYSDTINNRLYAGGNFNYAALGTISCPSNITYWDGSNWNPVGVNGPAIYPRAISIYKGELYVGFGNDTVITSSNDTLNFITRWDGSDWKPLGKGMNCSVQALYVFNNELAVGGCFTRAGDTSANSVASWSYSPNTIHEINNDKEVIKIIPNPFNYSAKVELPETFQKYFPCTFKLFDVGGKEAMEVKNITSLDFTISKAAFNKGVYFYKLLGKEKEIVSGKLVIE
jgi:hypothetical protein